MSNEPKAGMNLDPEMLAAYIDNRLTPEQRAEVEAELARDPDSYSVLIETMKALDDEAVEALKVSEPHQILNAPVIPLVPKAKRSPMRSAIVVGVLASAAALLLIARVQPEWVSLLRQRDSGVYSTLIAALEHERVVEGRLTGGFNYAPLRTTVRGSSKQGSENLALLAAAGELQKRARQDPNVINVQALASAQLAVGELSEAIAGLRQLADMEPQNAAVLSDLAAAHLERFRVAGEPTDALQASELAMAALRLAPEMPEALFNRALSLEFLGFLAEAKEAWSAYLRIDSTTGWATEARRRLENLAAEATGDDENPQGRRSHLLLQTIEEWADQALSGQSQAVQLRTLDHKLNEANALALSQGDESIVAEIGAIRDLVRTQPAKVVKLGAEAYQCLGLGLAGIETASFDVVRETSDDCVRRFETARLPAPPELRLLQSTAFYLAGDLESARGVAVEIADSLRDRSPVLMGRASFQLGGIEFVSGRYEVAARRLQEAIRDFESANEPLLAASAHDVLAHSLSALGLTAESWFHHVRALQQSAAGPQLRNAFAIRSNFSAALVRAGLPNTALVLLAANQRVAESGRSYAQLSETLYNVARIQTRLGDESQARHTLQTAADMLQRVEDATLRSRISSELFLTQAELDLVNSPSTAAVLVRQARNMFTSQGSRMRLARTYQIEAQAGELAGLADGDIEPIVARGIALVEGQEALIEQQRSRTHFRDSIWALYESAVLLRVRQQRPVEALLMAERGRSRYLMEPARLTVQEVARGPVAHVAVVVFSVTENTLLRWTLVESSIHSRQIPVSRTALSALVDGARAEIRSEGGAGQDKQWQLSNLLFGDMPPRSLAASTWIVVPDGALARAPFSALPAPGTDRLILDDRLLAQAVSLSSALKRTSLVGAEDDVDLVGTMSARDHSALRGARTELSELATLYPTADASVAKRGSVTTFLDRLRRPGILHFAGHAVVDESSPWLSRLVLSPSPEYPSGLLYAHELTATSAKKSVVILGACSTADGLPMRGTGMTGLAAALGASGVPFVVATLWDVPDDDTKGVFVSFHRYLMQSRDPLAAVAATQRSARAAKIPASAWAALTIVVS